MLIGKHQDQVFLEGLTDGVEFDLTQWAAEIDTFYRCTQMLCEPFDLHLSSSRHFDSSKA